MRGMRARSAWWRRAAARSTRACPPSPSRRSETSSDETPRLGFRSPILRKRTKMIRRNCKWNKAIVKQTRMTCKQLSGSPAKWTRGARNGPASAGLSENAEIPLFSLKIKDFTFKKNALQIVFLSLCVLLLIFFQYLAIPLVIITYVLLSVINNKFLKK